METTMTINPTGSYAKRPGALGADAVAWNAGFAVAFAGRLVH
jgi:hypothetical protein